jgi:polyvinyl alcohol dehydrogenase (cytochrome)
LLWKSVRLEAHFAAMGTGAPLLHVGVLYVPISSFEEAIAALPGYKCCTFRGGVVALEAATGKQIWKAYTIPEAAVTGEKMLGPSGAGVWSTPTFDAARNAIYVATGDNYSDPPNATSDAVVAFDAATGKMLWSRQLTEGDAFNLACSIPGAAACPEAKGPDFDFGQAPILVSLGGGKRALVIGQKSGVAHAMDPDNGGEVLWQTRVGPGSALGGSQWGSASDGSRMYVASSDIAFAGS